MAKRKGVALMEVVSHGSPQKMLAREGQCYPVSSKPGRERDLRPLQMGIQKSLSYQVGDGHSLESLIKAAVSKALAEERKKSLIFEDDVKQQLVNGITIRSLLSDWSKTSSGRECLNNWATVVNHFYSEGRKTTDDNVPPELPYHRKVQHNELLTELKHLIKEQEAEGGGAAAKFLGRAKVAIEEASGLSGSDFIDLARAYVLTNKMVHVKWTPEKLAHVRELAEGHQLQVAGHTPTPWIDLMITAIEKDKGWI